MLQAWQAGELGTQQLWDWASHRFQAGQADYDDWDGEDSVAREVLTMLDSLDLHLMLVEDVPLHLSFLQSPLGAFSQSQLNWHNELAQLNYNQRRLKLRDNPIYAL